MTIFVAEGADPTALGIDFTYGTVTFFTKNPEATGEQLVTRDELARDQRALNLTEWAPVLTSYGWNLIRPPETNVFFENDMLYVGAEIPAELVAMNALDNTMAVTDYARAVASLIFPHINISELPLFTVII